MGNNPAPTVLAIPPPEPYTSFEEYGLALIREYRDQIIKVCNRPVPEFWDMYSDNVQKSDHASNTGMKRIYINNNSSVLAVGHLDTVYGRGDKPFNFWWNPTFTKSGKVAIKMPTCDDRLGVATILVILPALGINVDILLTEGEESGRSTAKGFAPEKKYNWMFEPDRMSSSLSGSEDAVLYGYDDKEWRKTLTEAGFNGLARGSVTDISYMEDMGCKAFNLAIGYHDYHTQNAFFVVEQWARAVCLLSKFYQEHKDTMFPHTKKEYPAYTGWQGNTRWTPALWERGMVVVTKALGRKDKKGQLGMLHSNLRRDLWIVTDPDNDVVDVVDRHDIVEQVRCFNCNQEIRDGFATIEGTTWCLGCEELTVTAPEDILTIFCKHGGMFRIAGVPYIIEGLVDQETIIVTDTDTGHPIFLGFEDMGDVEIGADVVGVGSKVVAMNDDLVYDLVDIEKNKGWIQAPDLGSDRWLVPLEILMNA